MEIWTPCKTCFLRAGATPVHNPNGISIGSAVYAQITTVSLYFTKGPPLFPLKLSLPRWMWTPSNNDSMGPPELEFNVPFQHKLICGPMPNVMAALPNIGGALCSTP